MALNWQTSLLKGCPTKLKGVVCSANQGYLQSYGRRRCFYSRVLANWTASGDVTRSVSEGERSKQPPIQSVLKRQPSLTLQVTCGFAAL